MKIFETPEIEVIKFVMTDVITTSEPGREDELPIG